MNRVMKFSKNGVTDYEYDQAVNYIKNIYQNKNLESITDFLELEVVTQIVNERNNNLLKEYKLDKESKALILKYFGRFNLKMLKDILDEYNVLDPVYKKIFWELLYVSKALRKIEPNAIIEFIDKNNLSLYFPLAQKRIAKFWEEPLKKYLLKTPELFKLYIDTYGLRRQIYLPKFEDKEILKWGTEFCKLEQVNLGYLENIINWGERRENKIPVKVRNLAKVKHELFIDNHFKNNDGLKFVYSVGINKLKGDQIFDVSSSVSDGLSITFNADILNEMLDCPSILNALMYVFGLFNKNYNFVPLLGINDRGTLTDFFNNTLGESYNPPHAIKINMGNQFGNFALYYEFLKKKEIDLETVIAEYFNRYIGIELEISDFYFASSLPINDYYTRLKSLLPEFESILRQFELFRKNGKVDFEILQISSKDETYQDLKSFSDKKYLYLANVEIVNMCNDLFSVNSTDVLKNKSLYECIKLGYNLDEFYEYQQEDIKNLFIEKWCLLETDATNKLCFVDSEQIALLKYVWQYGYLSTLFVSDNLRKNTIKKCLSDGLIVTDNKLFSKQEIELLSYVLDDKMFDNSLAIRNKVEHGSHVNRGEEINKQDYLRCLLVMVFIVFKLNEEFEYKLLIR